jgi:hypothetical protein
MCGQAVLSTWLSPPLPAMLEALVDSNYASRIPNPVSIFGTHVRGEWVLGMIESCLN